jgi:hypothetical protein
MGEIRKMRKKMPAGRRRKILPGDGKFFVTSMTVRIAAYTEFRKAPTKQVQLRDAVQWLASCFLVAA